MLGSGNLLKHELTFLKYKIYFHIYMISFKGKVLGLTAAKKCSVLTVPSVLSLLPQLFVPRRSGKYLEVPLPDSYVGN